MPVIILKVQKNRSMHAGGSFEGRNPHLKAESQFANPTLDTSKANITSHHKLYFMSRPPPPISDQENDSSCNKVSRAQFAFIPYDYFVFSGGKMVW